MVLFTLQAAPVSENRAIVDGLLEGTLEKLVEGKELEKELPAGRWGRGPLSCYKIIELEVSIARNCFRKLSGNHCGFCFFRHGL